MKKISKVLVVVLALALCMFAFTGCSSYGKIEKAFLNDDWKVSTEANEMFKKVTSELEKEDIVITPHVFTKVSLDGGLAVVLEFNSNDDMKEAVEKSDTLKGVVKDIAKSDYVNGNCLLLVGGKNALEIFKNA